MTVFGIELIFYSLLILLNSEELLLIQEMLSGMIYLKTSLHEIQKLYC